MKCQFTQIVLIFAQNLLLCSRFEATISNFENSPQGRHSIPQSGIDLITDSPQNEPLNEQTAGAKKNWYYHSKSRVDGKKLSDETGIYFPDNVKRMFPRTVNKRRASVDNEQSGTRSYTEVELSHPEYGVNNFTFQMTLLRTNATNSSEEYSTSSAPTVIGNAAAENRLELFPTATNKRIRWFIIHLTNQTRSNTSTFETSNFLSEGNTSDGTSVSLLQNKTYVDLCRELYYQNECMLSNLEIDLRNLFHVLDTSETNINNPAATSKDSRNFSDATLHNLVQNFGCVVEEEADGLNISCTNVSNLYSIGEYLPNDTVVLDISFSYRVMLRAPLFPHLKRLKNLTLSNNHHKYITKAFMGLDNLEELDLSNNDIIVLLKAFSYIPKLKVLDLSSNAIRTIKVVSNAVSYLEGLQNLMLNHNYNITYITKEDLSGLKNCNIQVFGLFNTTIRYVERGAFNSMPNLKVLDVSVNYMNDYAIANVTCDMAETIEIAYFRLLLNVRNFPYDAVYCLRNTQLRELYLGNNYIKVIPVLPSLPNLRYFSMPHSSLEIIQTNAFQNVTRLETINLSGNKLARFPSALSSVKNLQELHIDSQISEFEYEPFIIEDYTFQHLTRLVILRLSLLHIQNLSRYSLYGLRNLKLVFLSMAGLYKIEDYAFETLTSLKMLDLRGNGISFLSNFTFFGLRNLEQLYLNSNKINFFSSVYPLQHCPVLNVILLQINLIRTIPKGMFSNLKELKLLILGKNKIIPWQDRIIHPNASLKILGLSENNIDTVSDVMLAEFRQVAENLDLSKNPFNCSKCGMREFQVFIRESNLSFHSPQRETKDSIYVCVNPESMQNEPLIDAQLPKISCEEIESEVLSLIAMVLIGFFLGVTVLASSVCYSLRWYIRYWIFHLKTSIVVNKESVQERSYNFDAFIIYSSVDTAWVEDHLVPSLEEQEPRYKLCIHQRDFQVGGQITENILEAIENSHKVILILTEEFMKSEWCMYELHLTQHKLFDDARDILVLVKLRSIDKNLYTKNVSYIEKTRKCYTWTDSHIGQKLFWEQIRKHLGPPRTVLNIPSTAV